MVAKNLYFLFFLSISVSCLAQEKGINWKKVSPTIQKYVADLYPKAKHIRYFVELEEGQTYIECNFHLNKEEYSLKFLNEKLVETELEIEFEELPSEIQTSIMNQLKQQNTDFKILECQEVNPGEAAIYEINVKMSGDHYYEYFFDKKGQFVRRFEEVIDPIPTQF
ncbi:MAG: hypothetical protein RL632_146 [Bacteroidota bacterium]|jgi:hypothetical protein